MDFHPKNMTYHCGDVPFLTFPSFERYPFVRHAFSTRLGGVSKGIYSSMNLAFGRGDPDENVLENYRRICRAAGLDFSGLISSAQDHHTFIRRVGASECGEGFSKPKAMKSVDGLMTNEPGVVLATHFADCVPLFFLDPQKRAIGLAHAGWRGTAAKIGAAAVDALRREYGCRPQDLIAAIGPSIGPCCFEVDAPVRDVFAAMAELHPGEWIAEGAADGKYMIDLWEANRRVLMEAGVPEQNITVADICTKCNPQMLFSHRASAGKRGGLAAFLELKAGKNGD